MHDSKYKINLHMHTICFPCQTTNAMEGKHDIIMKHPVTTDRADRPQRIDAHGFTCTVQNESKHLVEYKPELNEL